MNRTARSTTAAQASLEALAPENFARSNAPAAVENLFSLVDFIFSTLTIFCLGLDGAFVPPCNHIQDRRAK
jgi:hypothetical protein